MTPSASNSPSYISLFYSQSSWLVRLLSPELFMKLTAQTKCGTNCLAGCLFFCWFFLGWCPVVLCTSSSSSSPTVMSGINPLIDYVASDFVRRLSLSMCAALQLTKCYVVCSSGDLHSEAANARSFFGFFNLFNLFIYLCCSGNCQHLCVATVHFSAEKTNSRHMLDDDTLLLLIRQSRQQLAVLCDSPLSQSSQLGCEWGGSG